MTQGNMLANLAHLVAEAHTDVDQIYDGADMLISAGLNSLEIWEEYGLTWFADLAREKNVVLPFEKDYSDYLDEYKYPVPIWDEDYTDEPIEAAEEAAADPYWE